MNASTEEKDNSDHPLDDDEMTNAADHKPKVSSFDTIKNWIQSSEQLSARCDDGFIWQNLTIAEFDLEKAKGRIARYNDIRRSQPSWFESPDESTAETVFLEQKALCCTNFWQDSETSISILLMGNLDFGKYTLDKFNNILLTAVESMIADLRYQMIGIEIIVDFAGASIQTMAQLSTTNVLKQVDLYQNAVPVKINKIHLLNVHYTISPVISVTTYLANKLYGTQFFNHGSDLLSLHAAIPPKFLPFEYNGTAGTMETFAKEQMDIYRRRVGGTLTSP